MDKNRSVFALCKAYLAKFWLWNHPATSQELERHSALSRGTAILQTKLWIQVGQDAMETPESLTVTLGRKARILISVGFDLGNVPLETRPRLPGESIPSLSHGSAGRLGKVPHSLEAIST